ncbi:MAG: DUF554 domain-containing protein [Bifidobacteriaceae bacterium]|nr:DUF554 domain-containing protein [Bifidobacteriaceae bacterium]
MFPGIGTVVNVVAVLAGCGAGLALGHRFRPATRDLITQVLGLFSMVLGGRAIAQGLSPALTQEVGENAPLLVVLGALLLGALIGAGIRLEQRLDGAADWLRGKVARNSDKGRFIEAAVTSTLIFCVGPLSILGSLSDGLGTGAEQLFVKSVMDGFAAIAFTSSLGIGVMASVIPLTIYQGAFTVLGYFLGNFLSAGQVDALTATGGVILLGLGVRLAGIKKIQIGDLLPALALAPIIVWVVNLAVR